ncbi:MAG: c-type cytochrome [Acidobacteriota bacterium]
MAALTPAGKGQHQRRVGLARRIPARLLRTFAVLSVALLAVALAAVVQESRAEWRQWQSRFAALEGSNATHGGNADGERGLRQIWLPDLDRVDRCTSCHLGIASPDTKDAPQPFRGHSSPWLDSHRPDRFGCTACHGGQGEATTYRDAAHQPLPFWSEPMASRELMEARCGTCHQERNPPSTYWLARGRALMTDRNCVACHEIPGRDSEEVRAPRLDGLALKVSPAWLRGWLADPRGYLERSRMGDFRLRPKEVEALAAFLLQPHGAVDLDEVEWTGADPERGGEIFRASRCVTCHSVNGRGGTLAPELAHVAAKVGRDWLYSWIRDPHRLQPDTLMPWFRFDDDQVRDLAAYIAEDLAEPQGLDANQADPDPDLAAEGRRIFERRGCYSCHDLEGFPVRARIGPKLAGEGDRIVDPAPLVARGIQPTRANWLFTKVSGPERVLETARMPTFGFSGDEAAAVSVALLSLRAQEVPPGRITRDPDRPPYEAQGEFGALVRRYRCLSCHQIAGTGGTLSTVVLDRIGSQLRRDYIEQYIQNPIAVRVGLAERMPHLNITAEEATLLAGYLSTVMVDDAVEAVVPRDAAAVARGKELFDRHGCLACHIVGDSGGFVGPDLNGSGQRLQPGWTVAWVLDPERWKPGTLQPDHGLTREEAEALAAYTLSIPARKAKVLP